MKKLILSILIGLNLATVFGASTTTQATQSNFLDQGTPTLNWGTDNRAIIGCFGAGFCYRSLFKFQTPNITDATISKIDLKLYVKAVFTAGAITSAHTLTRSNWTTAGSTWNNYDTGLAWTSAGGDYTATVISSSTNPGVGNWVTLTLYGSGSYNPISSATMNTNYDFEVKAVTESGNNTLAYSGVLDTSAQRPYLDITYTTSTPAVTTFDPWWFWDF